MRYIRIFSELSNQLRYASQKRVMVEVALIKLTRPSMEPDLDSVLQRLKQLEAAVEDLEAGGFRPGTMVTAPMGAVPVTAGVQPQISGTQGQMAVPVQGVLQEIRLKQLAQPVLRLQIKSAFHRPS